MGFEMGPKSLGFHLKEMKDFEMAML